MSLCAAWATTDDLCLPCLGSYELDEDRLDQKLLEASDLLYQLSAQQFSGECEETISPCSRFEWSTFLNRPLDHIVHNGIWIGFPGCSCHSQATCSCAGEDALVLPGPGPFMVSGITVDGYDFLDYVVRGNEIIRTDGRSFPCCGDVQVSLTTGQAPPLLGRTAAAVLACELYMACYGEFEGTKCRLPRNVQSISRQGVSVIFNSLTRQSASTPFRFGITEIDLFLEAYAPYGQRSMSVVISPDTPVWTAS